MKESSRQITPFVVLGAAIFVLGWILGDLAPGPQPINLGRGATARFLKCSGRTFLIVDAPNQKGVGPTCFASVTILPTGIARFEVLSYSFLFPRRVQSPRKTYIVDVTKEIVATDPNPQVVGEIDGKEQPIVVSTDRE